MTWNVVLAVNTSAAGELSDRGAGRRGNRQRRPPERPFVLSGRPVGGSVARWTVYDWE
jgi:hypothetical protein